MIRFLKSRRNAALLIVAAVLALSVFGVTLAGGGRAGGGPAVRSAAAETGSVRRTVSASGSVRPLVTVEVGSQLSGQISELYADFNDAVSAGQVVARLDPRTFEARVVEAEAALAVARSNVAVQEAGLRRAEARLTEAVRALERARDLSSRGNISEAALDTARANAEAADAELAIAKAQVGDAAAVVRQREATLGSARVDLERTDIRSPIDGVVINRAIDIGQTVAASLSAPLLFEIAQDLTKIEVETSVDEADIGAVRPGAPASFEVDAFPGEKFEGVVQQVRLSPLVEGGVVTYTVIVRADNPEARLLPGMTANVDIITGERDGVLTIPNQALRFRPRGDAEALVVESEDAAEEGEGRGRGEEQLQALKDALDLSDEEAGSVQNATRAAFQQFRARFTGGPPSEELREEIRKAVSAAVRAALPEEKRAAYDGYVILQRERRPAEIYVALADGRMEKRAIVVGVSDLAKTEVVRGLEEGEKVVVDIGDDV